MTTRFCYADRFTTPSGDALPGYFVRVLDKDSGAVQTIYADENDTPIATVSGVANAAKQDSEGNFTLFVAHDVYSVELLDPQMQRVKFLRYKNLAGIDVAEAEAAVTASAASATAAAGSATSASTSATTATTQAGIATTQAVAAAASALASGFYPSTAGSNVPRGATGTGAITGGSGGTNGTFALAFTGGNFSVNPTGTFTVSGGAVTAITITGPGLYIGASPTAPTLSFAASSGLSGASATLTVDFLVTSGRYYWVTSSDTTYALLYQNASGTATLVSPVVNYPLGASVVRIAGDTTTARTSTSMEEMAKAGRTRRATLDHTPTSEWDFWDSLKASETTQLFPQDGSNSRIHICWDTSRLGFAESGILRELHVRTAPMLDRGTGVALATTTGAKVQAWVVRPSATLPTTGVSVTVSKVAAIGELTLPDSTADVQDDVHFVGLNIPVLAGDVIALRIVNAGIRYGGNSGGTHEYDAAMSLLITDTDTSLSAIATSKSDTAIVGTSYARRFFHRAIIEKNDAPASGNVAMGTVRLDNAARIPFHVSSRIENPWHGKKVAICGSSISTAGGGGTVIGSRGHWLMTAEMLQFNPTFLAVGSGLGQWPGSGWSGASYYIAGTEAEFVSRYGAGGDPGQYSYERRLIGQSFDAIIMPDCINDTNNPALFSIGTRGSTDRSTLWGAFQRMIEAILTDRPACQIFLQTPAHRWANYTSGTPSEQANRIQWADAMKEIADWYGLPPVIDFIRRGGIGPSSVQAGNGLDDGIHPDVSLTVGPRPQMALYAANHMRNYGYLAA